jgi:hypothetical protein
MTIHLFQDRLNKLHTEYRASLTPRQRAAEDAEIERGHEADIRAARNDLTRGLQEAIEELGAARFRLDPLTSADDEYEGQTGDGIHHHIDTALRSIRAVQAIHQHAASR